MREDVDLQAHGRFHRSLPACDEPAARDEVAASKADLEGLLGAPCEHFSYPNGDFGPRDVELARAAGYLSARTVEPGVNTLATDPYLLRAVCVLDDASINVLAMQMTMMGPTLKRLFGRR